MDVEKDVNNRPPKELWKQAAFWNFFSTQFGDKGAIDKAKKTWSTLVVQRGKAVDYFEEVETLLLRLQYDCNSDMVMDKVIMGLKSHIQTHFIGQRWVTLNDLKDDVVQYDTAHWEINGR